LDAKSAARSSSDPLLARLVARWGSLSAAKRAQVAALLDAAE